MTADAKEILPTMNSKEDVTARREEAKTALLQLYNSNIGFRQLARENFLDLDLLRKLYIELGVPTDDPEPEPKPFDYLKGESGKGTPKPDTKRQIPGLSVVGHDKREKSIGAVSDSSLEPGEVDENEPASGPNLDTSTKPAAPAATSAPAIDSQSKISPASTKSPSAPPQKKPIERQTYIEKLRAAQKSIQKKPDTVAPAEQPSTMETKAVAEQSPAAMKEATKPQESHKFHEM